MHEQRSCGNQRVVKLEKLKIRLKLERQKNKNRSEIHKYIQTIKKIQVSSRWSEFFFHVRNLPIFRLFCICGPCEHVNHASKRFRSLWSFSLRLRGNSCKHILATRTDGSYGQEQWMSRILYHQNPKENQRETSIFLFFGLIL